MRESHSAKDGQPVLTNADRLGENPGAFPVDPQAPVPIEQLAPTIDQVRALRCMRTLKRAMQGAIALRTPLMDAREVLALLEGYESGEMDTYNDEITVTPGNPGRMN